MKKTAPVKESGLMLRGHFIKSNYSSEAVAVAPVRSRMYRLPVAANSATGFGDPMKLAHRRRSNPKAGAFFLPDISIYGGCARDTFGYAGCQLSRFANLRTAATLNRLATIDGSSKPKVGAIPMNTTRNPSTHAAAWKARAFAALRADSSLSVRLARYNAAMNRAREIEAVGGVK